MLTIDELRIEAKELQGQSLTAAERHFAAEGPWYYLNYWLGVPSSVFAAIAGATGLSQLPNSGFVAGIIALVVAGLTALLTLLDPSKKGDIFHRFAKEYEILYHEVGYFHRVESRTEKAEPAKLLAQLKKLVTRFNELNRDSPAISIRAQRRADKNLANGTGEVVVFGENQAAD